MRKLIVCLLLALTAPAFAANDPDSIGRNVRYLDYAVAKPIITFSPGIACDPALNRCFPTSSVGNGNASVSDALVLDVAPSYVRSLLCMVIDGHAVYVFRYFGTHTPRKKSAIQFHRQLKIESSVLSDPNLINRQTGQPFNGSIETMSTMLFAESHLEMSEIEQHQQELSSDCTKGLLSRSMLVNEYGLSSFTADRVIRGALKVTLRVNVMNRGVQSSLFEVSGRLYSD
jgi:hypothetical protein